MLGAKLCCENGQEMPDDTSSDVLRRKIGAPPDPLALAGMTPAKALRLAVTRAAEEGASMVATLTGFEQERLSLEQVLQSLEDPALVLELGNGEPLIGLAIWDIPALSAVVEQLITGRVVAREPDRRPPTRTDAAVVCGIMDRILQRFDAEMTAADDRPPVTGFRARGVVEDARAAALMLAEMDYRQYRLRIDFAEGARSGVLRLIFPWAQADGALDPAAAGDRWRREWQAAVRGSKVELRAVLYRLTLPLAELEAMAPGLVLPIPQEAIDQVSLEGVDGRQVAVSRLGQVNGHRALRLRMPEGGEASAATGPAPQALAEDPQREPAPVDPPGTAPPQSPAPGEDDAARPGMPVGADAPVAGDGQVPAPVPV